MILILFSTDFAAFFTAVSILLPQCNHSDGILENKISLIALACFSSYVTQNVAIILNIEKKKYYLYKNINIYKILIFF